MPVAHTVLGSSTTSGTFEIEMEGELKISKVRSSFQPVEVMQNATGLYIGFMGNLGMLSIEITDAQNSTVYAGNVDTGTTACVMVFTGSWVPGMYLLRITDRQGGCLQGSFNVNF